MVEKQNNENYKHIVRIANVDIPGGKSVRLALTKIKGIGINFADIVCKIAGVNRAAKTGNLSDKEIASLTEAVMILNV